MENKLPGTTAKDLIDALQLIPHPEGGFYRESYRNSESIITAENNTRNINTAIYYLLDNADKSHFHRIKSDELWFFHQGNPLEIVFIKDSCIHVITLGNDISNGEVPQAVIPANIWFGSKVKDAKGYSLVSCAVAPGFDFEDFEMAERKNLLELYPDLRKAIEEFTR